MSRELSRIAGALAVACAALLARPAAAQTFLGQQGGQTEDSGQAGASAGQVQLNGPRPVDVIRSTDPRPPVPGASRAPQAVPGYPAAQFPYAVPGAAVQPLPAPGQPMLPAPPPPTDFQTYVETSVGKVLPIFGQDLFTNPPTTFAPVDVPPGPEYVVGPGDEIVIRAWGQVEIDVHAVVSRDGTISLPRIGVLSVGGARFEDLRAKVHAAIARYYRRFELNVSMGQLRSIQVFVLGQVQRPGLYTVSSLSTLMNLLLASGGPSPMGSMRKVQLRRGSQLVGELDLYAALLKGDKSSDLRLLAGDVVFIPPVGALAAVAGPVKTPAIFELRPDTTLAELLEYAGGVTTTAATTSILLERLDQKRGRVVEELEWGEAAQGLKLRDGDVVQLRRVQPQFDNAITLRGTVIAPRRTAWKQGMTVADLIPDRNALISSAYWTRAAARAYEVKPLQPQQPAREGNPPTAGPSSANVAAMSASPLAQDVNQEALKTEVQNLVDEVNWDYAVVERLERSRLEPLLIPFNLARAIVDRDPVHNLVLQPGDIVTVFSKKDILTSAERRTYFVRVEGEVATPGVYQVRSGETLRQLVQRVGGLTPRAYLFGAEFQRASVRREQQDHLDEIATRAQQDLDRAAQERLARALTPEDAQTVRAEIENQRRAIDRLRTLRATGRMVLELRPEAASVDDLPDLVLEDGDRLFVPDQPSTVGVYGAVYNQSNLIYRPGKTVDDYLDQAGGPTRTADGGSVYVLRADGSVMSKRQGGWFSNFGGKRLMPSDNIVVPEEYAPTSWIKELKDWSQIFYQFGLGVAALKVLGL